MRNSTVAVVMIAMLVVGVPGVSAQTLTEGARVRVTRQPDKSSDSTVSVKAGEEYKLVPKQITGTVVRLDEEEVAVIWDGRLVSVPLERVTRLEVSRGGKSRGRGAGVMSRHLLKVSDGSSLLRRHSPSRQVLHLVL